jgi:hypothetical protein
MKHSWGALASMVLVLVGGACSRNLTTGPNADETQH